jgi:lysozyme
MMPKSGELTPAQKRTAAVGGSAALASAALLAMLSTWEGTRNNPYTDSVGVRTVCTGETHVAMRHYSDGECALMLEKRAKQFLDATAKINPGLKSDPYQWAAHSDLAYNNGTATYARSSVARLYAAGHKRAACEALGKYIYAGGKPFRGLVLRRNGDNARLGEIELCETGMVK